MSAPVEVTTRYATSVDEMTDAWAFVMEHLDLVGPDPTVKISPYWEISVHDMDDELERECPRKFNVVVEGMTHADHKVGSP